MSVNVPLWFAQQYATNIKLLLQQKGSRFRGTVMEGKHSGETASPCDQIGSVEMLEVTGRFNPMRRVDAPTARRWVAPVSFELPQLEDKFDKLKLVTDPKSAFVETGVAAVGRKWDIVIINGFYAAALTGKTGTSTTAHDTTNQRIAVDFGASAAVGMTVAKLKRARKKLKAAQVDVDNDPLYCAISAQQEEDLLNEAQVVSVDFNDRPVLVDGRLKRFLGFNFIDSELLLTDGSGYRRVPCWAKSGMHLGIWDEMQTSITKRNDLSGEPWQIYMNLTCGATRLEERKVVEILCSEA